VPDTRHGLEFMREGLEAARKYQKY
jgi:hypothetical protein